MEDAQKRPQSAFGRILPDIHLIDVGVLHPVGMSGFLGWTGCTFWPWSVCSALAGKQDACRKKDEALFHWSGIYEVVEIKWGQSDGGLIASFVRLAAEEGQAFVLHCVFKGLFGRVDQDQDLLVKIASADDEHALFRCFDLRGSV